MVSSWRPSLHTSTTSRAVRQHQQSGSAVAQTPGARGQMLTRSSRVERLRECESMKTGTLAVRPPGHGHRLRRSTIVNKTYVQTGTTAPRTGTDIRQPTRLENGQQAGSHRHGSTRAPWLNHGPRDRGSTHANPQHSRVSSFRQVPGQGRDRQTDRQTISGRNRAKDDVT